MAEILRQAGILVVRTTHYGGYEAVFVGWEQWVCAEQVLRRAGYKIDIHLGSGFPLLVNRSANSPATATK